MKNGLRDQGLVRLPPYDFITLWVAFYKQWHIYKIISNDTLKGGVILSVIGVG